METLYLEIQSTPTVSISRTRREGGKALFYGGGVCVELISAALDMAEIVWTRKIKFGRAYIAKFGKASLDALKKEARQMHDGLLHRDRRNAIQGASSIEEALHSFENGKMYWPFPGGTMVCRESEWQNGEFVPIRVTRQRPTGRDKDALPERWPKNE